MWILLAMQISLSQDWPVFGGNEGRTRVIDNVPPDNILTGLNDTAFEGSTVLLFSKWKDAYSNLQGGYFTDSISGQRTWYPMESPIGWINYTFATLPLGIVTYSMEVFDVYGNMAIKNGSFSVTSKPVSISSGAGLPEQVPCPCGFIQNDTCISFECCRDEECSSGICLDNKCIAEKGKEKLEKKEPGQINATPTEIKGRIEEGNGAKIIIGILALAILYLLITGLRKGKETDIKQEGEI